MNDTHIRENAHQLWTRRVVAIAFGILICTLSARSARAQVRVGIQAGVNLSRFQYENQFPYWDQQWGESFAGGVEVELPFHPRWSLMTGARYVRYSNRVQYDTGPWPYGHAGQYRTDQDYASVPVLLAFRPLSSRRLFLTLGPEVGFLISGRLYVQETRTSFGNEELPWDVNIRDELKDVNLSLDAGFGLEFPLGSHVAVTSVRYTHGIVSVAKKLDWPSYSDRATQGVEGLMGFRW